MSTLKEQSSLFIQDTSAFLEITNVADILRYKNQIDDYIAQDQILVLTILCNRRIDLASMDYNEKAEVYSWLTSLTILSIAVVNDHCSLELLDLIMLCDIRLGGSNLSIQFPAEPVGCMYNFTERCYLLMGKERNNDDYRSLLGATLYPDEICNLRLVNQIIDMNDVLGEVQRFINKLFNNKSNYQIKSILKCFNNYKLYGVNANRELLLEQESRQFCELVVKDYFKR